MDLSRWREYDDTKKIEILSRMGSAVRNGLMPPRRYTLLHPDAKLTTAQVAEVYQWTREVRKQLREQAARR